MNVGLGLSIGMTSVNHAQAASISLDGLVAAWDLTNRSSDTQTVTGAHGTSYDLTNGASTSVGGDDATWHTYGASMNNTGDNDYLRALIPGTGLQGDISVVVVASASQNYTYMVSHLGGWSLYATGAALKWYRAGSSGTRTWDGPSIPYGSFDSHFRVYTAVVPSGITNAPSLFVNETKTVCTVSTPDGAGTGTQPLAYTDFRIGAPGSFQYPFLTAAYCLYYNRLLTDGEVGVIVSTLRDQLASAGVTIP